MTEVDFGSWFEIASKRGSLGSVEAILAEEKIENVAGCERVNDNEVDWRINNPALLARNIEIADRWKCVGHGCSIWQPVILNYLNAGSSELVRSAVLYGKIG